MKMSYPPGYHLILTKKALLPKVDAFLSLNQPSQLLCIAVRFPFFKRVYVVDTYLCVIIEIKSGLLLPLQCFCNFPIPEG